jgi:FkbM family methyltransferase
MNVRRSFDVYSTFEVEGIADNDRYIQIVSGQFEKRFQQLANLVLPKDAVAFDVGANIGIVSIVLGSIFHAGKVFSFEPGGQVFELLCRNLARSALQNVNSFRYAVSDFLGEVSFVEDSAYGRISDKGMADASHQVAKCVTIDWLAAELSLSRLDLVKVDIEGFEPQAMRCVDTVVKRFNPVFLMELNPWCMRNYGKNDPIAFLEEMRKRFRHVLMVNKEDWTKSLPLKRIDYASLYLELENPHSLMVEDIVATNNDNVLRALEPDSGLV